MPATAEPLPTDIETLRAIIAAQAAELAAERRCREASEDVVAARWGLRLAGWHRRGGVVDLSLF